MASNDSQQQAPNLHSAQCWSRRRELAGIATAAIVLLLVTVSCSQSQGSATSPASLASPQTASPVASPEYPPLPSYTRFNPGAQTVYAASLGKHVNTTSTNNDGYTWTLHWIYADLVQALVLYSIKPPANTNYKILANDVKVTADDGSGYPRSPVYSVSGTGDAGSTIGSNGQADFFATVMNLDPVSGKTHSIALTLTFTGVADVVNAEESHKVADGTTMHVTVPFDPGHTVTVDKQGVLRGIVVNFDRLVLAPSGAMVFLSYPAFPPASPSNPATPAIVGGIPQAFDLKLTDGTYWQARAPGSFAIPDNRAIWVLHSPPKTLDGNWSLVLEPYGSDKQPATDQSQWLTFTFSIGEPHSAEASPTATPLSKPLRLVTIPKLFAKNPGVSNILKYGFGTFPTTQADSGATTTTFAWAYVDATRVLVYYTVTGLPPEPTPQSSSPGQPPPPPNDQQCNALLSISPSSSEERSLGVESGGMMVGDTLECFTERLGDFSSIAGSTVTVSLTPAGDESSPLTARVLAIRARVAEPHQQATVDGKSVTLDRVVVTPSGMRLFLSGPGKGPGQWGQRFEVNGWSPTADGRESTSQGPLPGTDESYYEFYYPQPPLPGPWIIKMMGYDQSGKPITDPGKTASFTVNLPPATWFSTRFATPSP